MIWLGLFVVLGGALYALRRFLLDRLVQSGRDAERADRAQADLVVAKKQADEMVKQRTVEDVARDLDAGDF